ncbi:MAG: AmmeMemoRadiSam system radical SAM enzyme [Candidatus Riflebacteria bacterium]|nr:AmmeMemoRadiSam system radical SAM enzyme [Candidatus Riflebacteria bacterium]
MISRRQFLADICTIAGTVGIGGMLLEETARTYSHGMPGSMNTKIPLTEEASFDERVAREKLERLEKAGFVPREAKYWEKTPSGRIRCTLCPTFCELRAYQRGRCRVRVSLENRLATLVYGRPCSLAIDPIEKKPVFHLLPGSTAFSFATAGCLLSCRYCQNWQISQANPEDVDALNMPPEKLVDAAIADGCRSIAYTYTEPTIFYEYMLDTARLSHSRGLYNVMVSCGYINPEPLAELLPHLDVFKVDLKGFSERFYRTVCGGRLAPVLAALELAAKTSTFVDIVTLMVPGMNDDLVILRSMFDWIVTHVGKNVSLFLSRFHPTFQLRNLPPTPVEILTRARESAMEAGLSFVYLGNVPGHPGETTWCPNCKMELVGRIGYSLTSMRIVDGACPSCKTPIPGIWK